MRKKIKTQADFKRWVKIELVNQDKTQKALAEQLNVPKTRISEAIVGKPGGKKYVEPLVLALGGNLEDFKNVI